MGNEEERELHASGSRKQKRDEERKQAAARASSPAKRTYPPIDPNSYAKKPSPASGGSSAQARSAAASSKPNGSGAQKKKQKKAAKRPLWLRIIKWFFGLLFGSILLAGVAGAVAFGVLYNKLEIPSPQKFVDAQTTTVYWGPDNAVLGKFSERNRTIVDTSTFPHPWIADAVIASEDRTFYTNKGVDFKGIVRALINNLRGGPRQGASTITQQYVDNYYLGRVQGYSGKVKEAILAIKINRQLSKETILNDYLNTIYFGRGSYGIQAAAQTYFGIDAKDLNLSQAAMIAGIIPSPNRWDPAVNKEKAEQRFKRVLRIMLEDKKITQQQFDEAKFPEVKPKTLPPNYWQGTNGYLLQAVRQELRSIGYNEDEIDTLGYKIYVTVDPKKQQELVDAVRDNFPADAPPGLRVGAVSLDTATGGLLAAYGGEDYLKSQLNQFSQARAQAGSTFKVFTLLAGLREGYSLSEQYLANSGYMVRGHRVNNAGGANWGVQDLYKATRYSTNTPFIQLVERVGVKNVIKAAEDAGYPPNTPGLQTDTPLITLGSASPTTYDIAESFNTIATGGIRRQAHIIARITDSNDNEVYKPNVRGTREFKPEIISELTQALIGATQGGGTAMKAGNIGWPAAGKTGTSNDFKSAQFVAFTRQILTAVTMYNTGENGAELSIPPMSGVREVYGSTFPGSIWRQYMLQAMQGLPKEPLFSVGGTANSPASLLTEKQNNFVTVPDYSQLSIVERFQNIAPPLPTPQPPAPSSDGTANGQQSEEKPATGPHSRPSTGSTSDAPHPPRRVWP